LGPFKFFEKFAEIFASQGTPRCTGINDIGSKFSNLPLVLTTPVAKLPPVSMTPEINFATGTAGVVDTGSNGTVS
jgi:hypothetical protein